MNGKRCASFFPERKNLNIMPCLAAVLMLAETVLMMVYKQKYRLYDVLPMLTVTVLMFVLSRASVNGTVGIVKSALSAILATLTAWEFYYLSDWIYGIVFSKNALNYTYDWICFFIQIVYSLLCLSLLVRHFLLSAAEKSRPCVAKRNRGALMAVFLVFVISIIINIVELARTDPAFYGYEIVIICSKLFEITVMNEVVGIEISLDMFRKAQ